MIILSEPRRPLGDTGLGGVILLLLFFGEQVQELL